MAKKRGFGGILTTLIILGGLGYGAWYYFGKSGDTGITYTTAYVTRSSLQQTISATGALETTRTVDVSTLVSGKVIAIHKDFNDVVEKGDLLLEIEPDDFEKKLTQTEADVAAFLASYEKTMRDTARTEELFKQGLVSQSEYDSSQTQKAQAEANKLSRETQLSQARLDLSRTKITAPEAGIVLNRNVEVGKTVNSNQSSTALFTIISDLTQLRILADVSEADIGNVMSGQPVSFTVDAYPNRTYSGTISQVRNQPKTSSSVVSYTCVISVTNEDQSLRPGMTASVEIIIANRPNNTLVIPNSALRARIPDELTEMMAKRTITPAAAATPAPTAEAPAAAPAGDMAGRGGAGTLPGGMDPSTMVAGGPNGGGAAQAGAGQNGGRAGGRGGAGGGRGGRGGNTTLNTNMGTGMNTSTDPKTVYKLITDADGSQWPEAHQVVLGISNGTSTEVLDAGGLVEGDALITFVTMPGTAAATAPQQQQQSTNPFGGQQGGGGRGGPGGGGFGGGGRGGF